MIATITTTINPTYEEVRQMFVRDLEEQVDLYTSIAEDAYMDACLAQYREMTDRLLTSDPDHGLAREIDQDGNVRELEISYLCMCNI